MNAAPCPLCGYAAIESRAGAPRASPDGGGNGCPHCRLAPLEPSLRGPRSHALEGLGVGLAALPKGLYFLWTTRGVKRWLLPPLLLTLAAFGALFWWLWGWVQRLLVALQQAGGGPPEVDPGWLAQALAWLLKLKLFVWLAQAGSLLAFLLVWAVAAFWAFSIVYEAVSGPFLDEIHGRIESRWFGVDPRNALQRRTTLSPQACALHSSVAGAFALLALIAFGLLQGPLAWVLLLIGLPLPFAVLGLARPEYGRWLLWVVRLEGGTLWVSLKAAAVAGVILLAFLPLKLVPGIGYLLFGCVAGFTTAVSLLDIPLERRGWSLSQRLAFLFHHALAVVALGCVSSLLFVIPAIGPILMVPAASVGGLWMVCKLDKGFLRP
jgi:uncharacterized protein involved in cysteine biosynthesis